MRLIRIGLAHLNSTVGAFDSNTRGLLSAAVELSQRGATVICFAEQAISGYPCEDLVLWDGFVQGQWSRLEAIAEKSQTLEGKPVLILGVAVKDGEQIYNCAAVICNGQIVGLVPKEKLPTYGVFYEGRTFSAGTPWQVRDVNGVPCGDMIFEFPFGTLAAEVCEDVWLPDGPMRRRAYSGAELIVNCSASPWRSGVVDTRKEIIAVRARENAATIAYVNMVGGNDSLVFDGGGWVNQNGTVLGESPRWREALETVDVDLDRTAALRHEQTSWKNVRAAFLNEHEPVMTIRFPSGPASVPASAAAVQETFVATPAPSLYDELLAATQMGLAGYFEKTGAFERIGVALSGGRDSVLSLVIAWLYARARFADDRAQVRDFVTGISMPSRYNSDTTKDIARTICAELGVTFLELSIEEAFERETEALRRLLPAGAEVPMLTLQNMQSRIRGMRMWNWANARKGLWLQTGNMSEKATGYTTVGGDLMGGYALLGNMPKTLVNRLLAFLHERHGFKSLSMVLETKASAELAEDQEDERDLMPFPVLDACFELFAGAKLMPEVVTAELRARFTDAELKKLRPDYQPELLALWVERFTRLFVTSIFKWVQAPQAVHLATLDLDRERALQLPVVQSMEWLKTKNRVER